MQNSDITKKLMVVLEKHGLNCVLAEDEWILPNEQLPAIRACWYPRESSGRLDVELLVDNDVLITESFAGLGQGDEAFYDALHNFMVNSLHIFLSAFWGINDPDQVLIEQWEIEDKTFTAYIGNCGTRASKDVEPFIPQAFFPEIEKLIKNEKLDGNINWIRFFFCNVAGNWTFEALLNNEAWEKGIQCLKKLPWEKNEGYYSVRIFIILREIS